MTRGPGRRLDDKAPTKHLVAHVLGALGIESTEHRFGLCALPRIAHGVGAAHIAKHRHARQTIGGVRVDASRRIGRSQRITLPQSASVV